MNDLGPLDARRLELAVGAAIRNSERAGRPTDVLTIDDLQSIVERLAEPGRKDIRQKVWQCLRSCHYDALKRSGDGVLWLIDCVPGLLFQIAKLEVSLDVWNSMKAKLIVVTQPAPLPLPAPEPTSASAASASSSSAARPGPALATAAGSSGGALVDTSASASVIVRAPQLPSKATAEAFYSALDHAQLVQMMMARDDTVRDLRKSLHIANTARQRKEHQLAVAERKGEPEKSFLDLERKRKGRGKQLTDGGQLALALRTILMHASAKNVGMGLLLDISGQTVNRSIQLLSACLVQQSRVISIEHAQLLAECKRRAIEEGSRCVQLSVVAFSSDATNSNCFHKSKLHTTEVYAMHFFNSNLIKCADFGCGPASFMEHAVETYTLPDIQRVLSGTTTATYSLLAKQVTSTGLSMWPELFPVSNRAEDIISFWYKWSDQAKELRESGVTHVKVWAYTSDGGSDQAKFKKALLTATLPSVNVLCLHFPCILHSGALVTKGSLVVVDLWLESNGFTFKFFASVAKLMYVWRDTIALMFKTWCKLHGAASALEHSNSLPPTAISGRWGSISAALKRIVPCRQELQSTLRAVLPLTDAERVAARAAGAAAVPASLL